MEQLYTGVLKSKYFQLPVIVASIIFVVSLIYYSTIPDKVIFPDLERFSYNYYTDAANGGNSEVLDYQVTDSLIKLEFLLKNAFYSPYVGISIAPVKNNYIDASKYNQLSLAISGQRIDRAGISLFTTPIIVDKSGNKSEALYHFYLSISRQIKNYSIPLIRFKHPEWWVEMRDLRLTEKGNPDFAHLLRINIGSAYSPGIEKTKVYEISSITLTRNNKKLFTILFGCYFLMVALSYSTLYILAASKHKPFRFTVSYKPTEVKKETSSEEKCIEFINSNYTNSSLTLEMISKEAGITSRRITAIIHNKFNCNFKTYLNNIRINESKRLLTQTDLKIGEVAFKVGFNSQSHFNRVFKNDLNISPTEYREKNSF